MEHNGFGINKKNEKMLFSKMEDVNYPIELKVIRNFTSTDYLARLQDRKYRFKIKKKKKNVYEMTSDSKKIEFSKITDIINMEDKKKLKEIRKKLLDCDERRGKCHNYSISFIHCGNKLVTGYVNDISGKHRTIHSWIENGNNVYDFTYNLVISKKNYYELLDVLVLNEIDKDTVLSDYNNLFNIYHDLSNKMYCLFRNEIVNDLEKAFSKNK